MRLTAIPSDTAVAALDLAADELRGLVRYTSGAVPSEEVDRRRLVALVLQDLALNVRAGVSQLVRAENGSVFITTAAIELVEPADDDEEVF